MSRQYAGILGTLAMTVVIFRGLLNSSAVEGTLLLASSCLIVFAIIGAVLGRIAQSTVDESVRAKLEQQLAAQGANRSEANA